MTPHNPRHSTRSLRLETIAIHAGREPDPQSGAVADAIQLSTTFARDAQGRLIGEYLYSRNSNPNRTALEQTLAELEGGEAALAYPSGLGAIHALLSLLAAGDHVLAPEDLYHGTRGLLNEEAGRGLEIGYAPLWEPGILEARIQKNTRLIFVETPSNPLLNLTDIAALAKVAKAAGAWLAVDNTLASPVLQRPLALGADYAVHSSTKYFGGHSDVLGGALIASLAGERIQRLRDLQIKTGAVPSAFDCWLIRRGIATLPVRVQAQSSSALRLAQELHRHPGVERVHYPGLPDHPHHELAKTQMSAFGGMLSIEVRGGESAAARAISRVRLFTRATSLGSVESLIEHRFAVEGPDSRTPRNLLRLSIGLEHPDDLIADLEYALGS